MNKNLFIREMLIEKWSKPNFKMHFNYCEYSWKKNGELHRFNNLPASISYSNFTSKVIIYYYKKGKRYKYIY